MQNSGEGAKSFADENNHIFNLIPIPMALLDGMEHKITLANDAMCNLWRIERSDKTIGRPLAEALPEIDSTFLEQLSQVLATGLTYTEEEVLLTLNDQQGNMYSSYVDYTYQPLTNAYSQITGVLVTAQDVSQKVSAMKALREASAQLEQSNKSLTTMNKEYMTAIDIAKIGTWKLDIISNEFTVTDRTVEIFGFQDNIIRLTDFVNAVKKNYQTEVMQAFKAGITKGIPLEIEFPVCSTGASERWVRLNGKVIYNQLQQMSSVSGTILDITGQKTGTIRKNQFIGMVSHELKTPLTSLTGMLQLVARKVNAESDLHIQHILEKSLHQVGKMTHMINSFVSLSRLESGKFELQLTEFDMEELIAEYLGEAQMIAPHHQFVQHDCQTVKIKADRIKIGAVLANMVSNAIKYSPQGTSITISCKKHMDSIEVSVKDQGCGIAETDKKRVFERFSDIDNPHIMHSSGFGIGLYLCSEIVSHHHGKIWVENNSDAGCTFSFKLPIRS